MFSSRGQREGAIGGKEQNAGKLLEEQQVQMDIVLRLEPQVSDIH